MPSLLFRKRIKKKDVGDFCQKLSMLLDTGYDACSAVRLLAERNPHKKRDRSADGLRRVALLLLPSLTDGYALHESMRDNPEAYALFREYLYQVQVGEDSGRTSDVLLRISEQIKKSNKTMTKLKSALTYPIIVLIATFSIALYLFSNVIPGMISNLQELGISELPTTTKLVMGFGQWMKSYGVFLFVVLFLLAAVLLFYSKTFGKVQMAKVSTRVPLIGQVVENNAMGLYFRSWEQMILAGAEMSISLKSAAEAVPNLFLKRELMIAQRAFADNGIPVHEAISPLECVRALEIQTIRVAMESDKLANTLHILAEDREFEANKSVDALVAAVNPIMIAFAGVIVGILVLSVYQPIISVSSALG